MNAAALTAAHSIDVNRRPVDEPGPGEVRIRVEACGVCGSDLHFFALGPIAPGNTPGHEIAGHVDQLGDGVEGFAVGDRVAVEPLSSCGRCDYCRKGQDAICPQLRFFGVHCHGGFAEFISVPARRLFRVPGDVEAAVAALAEPMAVAVHGLRLGGFEKGQRVLVLGAGTVGLLTTLAAKSLGAGEVILTARYPHQAELGRHLGAERVLTEADAAPMALGRLGSEAPVDLVMETVGGKADTLRGAAAAVRPGGTISVLGIFLGGVSLDTLPLFIKENTIVWSNCYGRTDRTPDFATAVDLVAKHRDALAAVTTHRVPLHEIRRAYALAGDKSAGAVKVTVLP
jgi:2-desacetyl-2-hydroxyethyl bacteriochlorophyllide A dehydrogenase